MPVKRPAKLIKNRWTCCFIPKQMVVRLVMFDSNHWFFWASLPASGSISVATCYKSQEPHYGGLHTWTSSHITVYDVAGKRTCAPIIYPTVSSSFTLQFPHHLPCSFLTIYPTFTQHSTNIYPHFTHPFYPPFTHHLTPRIHMLPPFSPRRLVQHETTMFGLLEHLRPGGSGDSAHAEASKMLGRRDDKSALVCMSHNIYI